jgi:hypothetical protein
MMVGTWKSVAMASAKAMCWSDSVDRPEEAFRRGV